MDTLLTWLDTLDLPEKFPYLLAVLGLILIWKFHDMQVKAGRIKAKDFWERSGVRLFLRATPNDAQACLACREATNVVFLPGVVTSKKFKPQEKPCTNPAGCRCLMVGLYGGWEAAGRALQQLKKEGGRIRLSDGELKSLVESAKEARAGASADRISIHMLQAMRDEGSNPEAAMEHYRYVVDRAEEDRDLPFVVPSFLRLSELLERTRHLEEALDMVERCLKDYGEKKKGPDAPTDAQRALLSNRKTYLVSVVRK